jgi:hypothetical protein
VSADVGAPDFEKADTHPEDGGLPIDVGPMGTCEGAANGTLCDDGNLCTLDDTCDSGVCVGGVNRICDEAGACQDGICDPSLGCVYTTAPDGAACSISCFDEATCELGTCTADPDSGTLCPDPESPCVTALGCDSTTGACTVEIYSAPGSACDLDDNRCTFDTCDGVGACASTGEIETCDVETLEQPCWTHTCIPKDGSCVQTLFIEGGSCNDLSPCTVTDTCILTDIGQEACLGTPVTVDDLNPCTNDYCESGVVHNDPIDGSACPTGDACTPMGTCVAGACTWEGCGCASNSECMQPENPCLGQVICDQALEIPACVLDPTSVVLCPPSADACVTTACSPQSGQCEDSVAQVGAGCNDDDACTDNDICTQWGCQGVTKSCNDGNPCTDDACLPGDLWCSFIANTDPCEGGTCADGACEPEEPECEPVVYGHAGQGTNNGWTCQDVCGSLGGTSTDWTGVQEQLDYCHTLAPQAETIMVDPNNHSYPLYDKQNDKHMCKVNANGWANTANWAGNGTPDYGDIVLCRCQVSDCPCTSGCAGLQCGVDGCGNDCGECPGGTACNGGLCGDVDPPTSASGVVYSDMVTHGVYYWTQASGSVQIGSCLQPWGLHFVAPDLVYAACIETDSVERITLSGEQTTLYTSESAFFNARAITQHPEGGIYVASSTVTATHVWEVGQDSVTPYSTIGSLECGGIAFDPSGTLFWADFKDDGFVVKEAPGGGIQSVIPSFPDGFTLRDMQLGDDGLLYIVGATQVGGLRIHQATGELVESGDLPGNGFGVARGPGGDIYVLVNGDTPGVYKRNGPGWDLVVETPSGLGTVRVVP